MSLPLTSYLTLSSSLFLLGVGGLVLNRRNILLIFMSIELMLLGVNLNFIIFSVYLDDLVGQVFALLILTVAAAEAAVGLAILIVYYRTRGSVTVEGIHLLRG
jgi:NADH-quinone oxidoreductase subunit K